MEPRLARSLWRSVEPYHAVVYFAPEARERYAAAGLKGGWMGYFASRSAAMGPVPAEVVVATFYNFAPRMVTRAIPDAWSFSTPEQVLSARLAAADATLRRLLGDEAGSPAVATAAELARAAAGGCDPAGRALFAAHASRPWPDEPHLALWHAATLLREHRGDGHVAALLHAGIDGCEAHVLMTATGGLSRDVLQPNRGWTDDEWAAAEDRLRSRDWLDPNGMATEAGRAARQALEDHTDVLALAPCEEIGPDRCERLRQAMAPLLDAVTGGSGVPFPNPMGVPKG